MGKIKLFDHGGQSIRVVYDDHGQRWYVAADVCKCLQVAIHKQSGKPNVTVATRDVDRRHKQMSRIDTPENPRNPWTDMMTLSEPGLNSMLTNIEGSEAKRFKARIKQEPTQASAQPEQTSVDSSQSADSWGCETSPAH